MEPMTIEPGMLFAVREYPYTTFEFGTDRAYRAKHGDPEGDHGTPWAFPHAAVISAHRQPERVLHLFVQFGTVVHVPGYGNYTVERDHNQNVKFVKVTS
jgi:hypothetical protein